MTKKTFQFLALVLLLSSPLQAVILESGTIADIMPHVTSDTLVLFDIDDTIIKVPDHLGSDSWFYYMVEQKMAMGFTCNQATEQVLPLYYLVHFFINLQPVNQKTIQLIHDLQEQKIHTMALTARSMPLVERTIQELARLKIDFSANSLYQYPMKLSATHVGKYDHGIIFCSNNNKASVLFQFLNTIDYHPKQIIFIDDKLSHLSHVEKEVEARGITFVGLRYTGSDARKKCFDPQAAEQQLVDFKIKQGLAPIKKKENSEAKQHSCASA